MVSSLDLLPTALELAGVPLPTDRVYDGRSMVPILTDPHAISAHEILFFYGGAMHDCYDYYASSSVEARGTPAMTFVRTAYDCYDCYDCYASSMGARGAPCPPTARCAACAMYAPAVRPLLRGVPHWPCRLACVQSAQRVPPSPRVPCFPCVPCASHT